MSTPLTIALIVFAFVFGSALAGFRLGRSLPGHKLDSDSKDIVKLATGLVGTLSALVLGLLVSSAKGTFDQFSNDLTEAASKVVQLDRVLAQYGPETREIRAGIKSSFITVMDQLTSGDEAQQTSMESSESFRRFERLQAAMRALTPQNEDQRGMRSRAIQISNDLNNSRWLFTVRRSGSISVPLLVALIFWLSLIFAAWGALSPRNLFVQVALFACALSVSGAVFLILEMDQPLSGFTRVSPAPLRKALSHLGE